MIPYVILLLVYLAIVLATTVWCKVDRGEFNRRFPPISDAEFLARCRPGVDPDIALRVRQIVAEQLGVDYQRIYPSSRFVEDLGAD